MTRKVTQDLENQKFTTDSNGDVAVRGLISDLFTTSDFLEDIYVDPAGDDAGDGSIAKPFKTIQKAIDSVTDYAAASSGGSQSVLNTITIKNGLITAWTQE